MQMMNRLVACWHIANSISLINCNYDNALIPITFYWRLFKPRDYDLVTILYFEFWKLEIPSGAVLELSKLEN